MNILRTFLAIAALCLQAGCTIESDIILPDPTATGEAIASASAVQMAKTRGR